MSEPKSTNDPISANPAQVTIDKQDQFGDRIANHYLLKQAFDALWQAIHYPGGASIIAIAGPTGVGKTTLLKGIFDKLYEEWINGSEFDPGSIPYIKFDAPAPESGSFNWKMYFKRGLSALLEPLIDEKVGYERRQIHQSGYITFKVERLPSSMALRVSYETALEQRRVRIIFIDEAHHIKKVPGGKRLLDQMDTIKSMTNPNGNPSITVIHVLFGTYELLDLVNLSAQLDRRSIFIHFRRYQADNSNDMYEFKRLLRTFQLHLPIETVPDLESRYEWLYEGCLGCTGMLKSWLRQAVGECLESGGYTLSWKHIENHAVAPKRLVSRIREIREGEERLAENDTDRKKLRALLGMLDDADTTITKSGNKSRNVGQRSPKRDKVGK